MRITSVRVSAACLAALAILCGRVASQQAGTATLSGRVIRGEASGRAPVARAVVSATLGDGRGSRQAVSDDQGRFELPGLAAGGYLLTAAKSGWVKTYYGSPRPGHPPGLRVVVADGAKVTIDIPIVPGGVIAGRIVDENGQPMALQFPWLLEQRLVGDRLMLARMRLPYGTGFFERMSNDLGEFRLFGLPPGTYHIALRPGITSGARLTTQDEVRWALQPPGASIGPAPPQGAVAGYTTMYSPGTADPSQSQPIVVGPGEVREGLTFRVGFVPVARVEGTVRRVDGAAATGVRVSLDARVPQVNLEGSSRTAAVDASGRFVLPNVPPGDYRLSARSAPQAPPRPGEAAPAPSPLLWAQTDLVVYGQDVQGLGLTLAPASVVTGRLSFTGATVAPPADLSVVQLQFIATDALASALAGASSFSATYAASVEADGTFRVSGLPPDRYTASASWPGIRNSAGVGWWLTNVLVGGKDIADAPIDVRANEDVPNVTIGFRDRIGAVEGALIDAAGRPAPQYFVLAFPIERASWTTTSRRAVPAVRPGTDGRFRVAGLLAGQYYLAVVTAAEPDEIMIRRFSRPSCRARCASPWVMARPYGRTSR